MFIKIETLTMQKLEATIIPSLVAGAVGSGIYFLVYGNPGVDISFGPVDVPVWAAVGASVALGNVAGEVLTQYVLPMIPKNEKFEKYENIIVPPLMTGLTTFGIMYTLISKNTEIAAAVGIGAASSLGSNYIYGMLM